MAENSLSSQNAPASGSSHLASLGLCLEVRQGSASTQTYDFESDMVLIGTVPGCDLRLSGGDLPPLLCTLRISGNGLVLRKLAPALPLLVNQTLASSGLLVGGDTLQIGTAAIKIREIRGTRTASNSDASESLSSKPLPEQQRLLQEGLAKLQAAQRQFDEDRKDWEQDAERQAEALARRSRQLLEREKALAAAHAALERQTQDDPDKPAQPSGKEGMRQPAGLAQDDERDQLEKVRVRLVAYRDALYEQYRKRRDLLATLQESVNHAARKVQEEKRSLADTAAQVKEQQSALLQQQTELQRQKEELEIATQTAKDQHRLVEEWQKDLEQEFAAREAQLRSETQRSAAEQQKLAEAMRQYQADLIRADRRQANLDDKEAHLKEVDEQLRDRAVALEREAALLAEQSRQVEEWDARLRDENEQLTKQRAELESVEKRLIERSGTLETQQGVLVALRARAERLQRELLQREQQLTDQRLRLDQMEASLRESSRAVQEHQRELQAERAEWSEERQQFEERCTTLEAALDQLRQLQASFEEKEAELAQREAAARTTEHTLEEKTHLLRLRAERLQVLRQRLVARKNAIHEQELKAIQADEARETLQEQLRRRGEALQERERQLGERTLALAETESKIEAELESLNHQKQALAAESARLHQEYQDRDQKLVERENRIREEVAAVRATNDGIAAERQALLEERARLASESRDIQAARTELDQLVAASREGLPEVRQQAVATLERIGKAREQLRAHLAEVHSYSQQTQTELREAHRNLSTQVEHLRQDHHALVRAQNDHRHAVSAFRQHLSEWQAQLGELRQTLAQGESRLDQRQAQLEEQARRMDETSSCLAERFELLKGQEADVALRRDELTRQLGDMQSWYRQKLRELAERRLLNADMLPADVEAPPGEAAESQPPTVPPADRHLAELLTAMALVDGGTLGALLEEAQNQGQSLRSALLSGDYLTAYQMELIEEGQLEALVMGPLRVVDRIRLTPHEAVYRVFDPRRGEECLLRRIGTAVAATQQQEFRDSFRRAARLRHPNLAWTWEVLEFDDGPAALQEWTTGVPATEWASLVWHPAVMLQLLEQAASGIRAAHEAGLFHGHLHAGRLLLTSTGDLKVCGIGEPHWLHPDVEAEQGEPFLSDLRALGRIAAQWSEHLPAGAVEPLPDSILVLIRRLVSSDEDLQFASAAALLDHLRRLRSTIRLEATHWQRLLDFAANRLKVAGQESAVRRSA